MSGLLEEYGFELIGTIAISDDQFLISVFDSSIIQKEQTVYAFLVANEIVRIGSSKAKLSLRLKAWQRDVSAALQGRRSPTPKTEAEEWRTILSRGNGKIYARAGTLIETPVGKISAYLSEERALIERHKPRFCRR